MSVWIATGLVTVFIVYGTGAEDLTWAFQIGFVGSVLFGYLALLVLDESRWTIVRNLVSSLCLISALMCSSVGVACLIAAAILLFRTRGLSGSLTVVLTPAVVYITWYFLVGRNAVARDHISSVVIFEVPSYLWTGLSSMLGGTFGLPNAGPALLVVFLCWIVHRASLNSREGGDPAVLSLLAGAVVFLCIAGLGRANLGISEASSSRYAYILFALLLPAIGLALTAPLQSRPTRAVIVGGVLVGVLMVNLDSLRTFASNRRTEVAGEKVQLLTTASLLAEGVRSLSLAPVAFDPIPTVQEMIKLERSGELGRVKVSLPERVNDEVTMGLLFSSATGSGPALQLLGSSESTSARAATGCTTFSPTGPTPQVELRLTAARGYLSIQGPPASQVTLFLVSPNGAGNSFGQSEVLSSAGTGNLTDIDSRDYLAVSIAAGVQTTMCGVS